MQDEDPHAVAKYVMNTDLGTILNGKYRRWARKFLRSLRRAMSRFFKVDTRGFQSNSFPLALTLLLRLRMFRCVGEPHGRLALRRLRN